MPIWVLFGSFVLWRIRHTSSIWRVLKQSLKIPWINKIPPPNLSIIVFLALSYQNGIDVPPTKRKCLKSSYLDLLVLME